MLLEDKGAMLNILVLLSSTLLVYSRDLSYNAEVGRPYLYGLELGQRHHHLFSGHWGAAQLMNKHVLGTNTLHVVPIANRPP